MKFHWEQEPKSKADTFISTEDIERLQKEAEEIRRTMFSD